MDVWFSLYCGYTGSNPQIPNSIYNEPHVLPHTSDFFLLPSPTLCNNQISPLPSDSIGERERVCWLGDATRSTHSMFVRAMKPVKVSSTNKRPIVPLLICAAVVFSVIVLAIQTSFFAGKFYHFWTLIFSIFSSFLHYWSPWSVLLLQITKNTSSTEWKFEFSMISSPMFSNVLYVISSLIFFQFLT